MTTLSPEQINQCQNALTSLHRELHALLEGAQEASEVVTLDQSRVGRVSRIDALQQQAMAKAELQQSYLRLKLIKQALNKVKSDDYGWCEDCDELINFERLCIKPESQYCISCQEKHEKSL